MLSVLIPIYNYNAFPLVKEIQKQLIEAKISFDIICIDDASTTEFSDNFTINSLLNCSFSKLKKNVGRSKIRNLLANKATYGWLLFLDADVILSSTNFIKNYLSFLKEKTKIGVLCGGITYDNEKPSKYKRLRWLYGKSKEDVSLNTKLKNPYKYFFSSNFLINKEIFNSIMFDENITNYGYEDTVFSITLKSKKITVFNIENPVIHKGLDDNIVFIKKIEKSVKNAHDLFSKGILKKEDIPLLTTFNGLKKNKILPLYQLLFSVFKKPILYNLKSSYPSILLLDFYKLGYLCEVSE